MDNVFQTGHDVEFLIVKRENLVGKMVMQIHIALDIPDNLVGINAAFSKAERDVGGELRIVFQNRTTSFDRRRRKQAQQTKSCEYTLYSQQKRTTSR